MVKNGSFLEIAKKTVLHRSYNEIVTNKLHACNGIERRCNHCERRNINI